MTYLVVGFADEDHYDNDELSWDGDDLYDSQDAAELASRSWMAGQGAEARVEIVELNEEGNQGLVRRVLTQTAYEDIFIPATPILGS